MTFLRSFAIFASQVPGSQRRVADSPPARWVVGREGSIAAHDTIAVEPSRVHGGVQPEACCSPLKQGSALPPPPSPAFSSSAAGEVDAGRVPPPAPRRPLDPYVDEERHQRREHAVSCRLCQRPNVWRHSALCDDCQPTNEGERRA